jgi:hypothetical protein
MRTFCRIITSVILLGTMVSGAERDALAALVERLERARQPAVLFIGNSYSFQAPKLFRAYAGGRGKTLRVEQVTHGGWTLARHAADQATMDKIREGGWDVVVFQEQSRIPSLPEAQRSAMMDVPLKTLADEARKHGAMPALYQTWGYRDGDAKLPGDDFRAMTARVRGGYREAARKVGNLVVVPVGDAWEREVASTEVGKLFQKDGSHPSAAGNRITARVFHETFFPNNPKPVPTIKSRGAPASRAAR